MSDTRRQTASRRAREIAIQISTIEEVARAPKKGRGICDRHRDDAARQGLDIEGPQDSAYDLDPVDLITVNPRDDAQGRSGHPTPNDDDGISSNGSSGNDFPSGKTYEFTYDTSNDDPLLQDNLLTITFPNEVATGGPARYRFTYGSDPGDQCRRDGRQFGGLCAPQPSLNQLFLTISGFGRNLGDDPGERTFGGSFGELQRNFCGF